MKRVVVTVQHVYTPGRTDVFEGSPKSVRAQLLLKFPFVRTDWMERDDLENVIAHLDRLQAFIVDLVRA